MDYNLGIDRRFDQVRIGDGGIKMDEWVSNNMTLVGIIIMIAGLTVGYLIF